MMTGVDIRLAARLLTEGKLVGIPTETVYGLAANALNADAVLNIFEAKNRPTFDPLIVHVPSVEVAKLHVTHFPDKAQKLADAFWPGPLTLVLPRKHHIPDIVCSGLETVGIRMPNHPMTLELLRILPFPLAAPSANPFGYISPTNAKHVEDQLGEIIPYILDGGSCEVGIESTIVDFSGPRPVVLRLGGLSIDSIEDVIGPVQLSISQNSNPIAPGQLDQHYAPGKPLHFGDIEKMRLKFKGKKIGILSFSHSFHGEDIVAQMALSAKGDLHEAARRLFLSLRMLDHSPIDLILAEPAPTHGLGAAINDRLGRAAQITR
jgi:L-threonylcarbamoyladenylate synthase